MSEMESFAYRDGAREEDFMEEAGKKVAEVIHNYCEKHKLVKHVVLLCGRGNNAGDAYVAGRYLLSLKYHVFAFQIDSLKDCSPLTQKNYSLFLSKGGIAHEINEPSEMVFPHEGILVDGLFGTGFHGQAKKPYSTVIKLANQSHLPIFAVDIPSALNGNTGVVEGVAIKATETIFLGLPKLGFFINDGWNHVGKLQRATFGLDQSYIDECKPEMLLLTEELVKPLLPLIVNNRNKYDAGLVVGVAGPMSGAAILSSLAGLRGGAGVVRLLYPKKLEKEFLNAPFEIIRIPYEDVNDVAEKMNTANAVFIGPGLTKSPTAIDLVKSLLPKLRRPMVLDADALNIIASERLPIPKNAVLTPHGRELARLLRLNEAQPITDTFLKTCQNFVDTHRTTLVLKGGPTFIFHPDEIIHVCAAGDPGMATAGSGDVLTGLITALLAGGLTTHHAALVGTYIHGLSGESAAAEKTSYSLIATDLIDHFSDAFKKMTP